MMATKYIERTVSGHRADLAEQLGQGRTVTGSTGAELYRTDVRGGLIHGKMYLAPILSEFMHSPAGQRLAAHLTSWICDENRLNSEFRNNTPMRSPVRQHDAVSKFQSRHYGVEEQKTSLLLPLLTIKRRQFLDFRTNRF